MNTRLSDITAKLTRHLHDVIQEFQVCLMHCLMFGKQTNMEIMKMKTRNSRTIILGAESNAI